MDTEHFPAIRSLASIPLAWRTPKAVALPPLFAASSEMLTKKPAMVTSASLAVLRSLSSAIFNLTCAERFSYILGGKVSEFRTRGFKQHRSRRVVGRHIHKGPGTARMREGACNRRKTFHPRALPTSEEKNVLPSPHQLPNSPSTVCEVLRLLLRQDAAAAPASGPGGRRRCQQRFLKPSRRGCLLLLHGGVGVERKEPTAQLAFEDAQLLIRSKCIGGRESSPLASK